MGPGRVITGYLFLEKGSIESSGNEATSFACIFFFLENSSSNIVIQRTDHVLHEDMLLISVPLTLKVVFPQEMPFPVWPRLSSVSTPVSELVSGIVCETLMLIDGGHFSCQVLPSLFLQFALVS